MSGAPNTATLVDRLDEITDLPALSTTHIELGRVIADEGSSLDDIVPLLSRDPGLVANLIKLANSVFYARQTKVDTIKAAVQRIGLDALADMALTVEVVRAMGSTPGLDLQQFWDHSVSTAVMTRGLLAGDSGAESAYAVALLHDIGLLIMARFFEDEFEAVMDQVDSHPSVLHASRAVARCDHLQLTIAMMEQWHFDESLIAPLRKLLDPEMPSSNTTDGVCAALTNAHQIMRDSNRAFEWDVLPEIPFGNPLNPPPSFERATGISAAVMACCLDHNPESD